MDVFGNPGVAGLALVLAALLILGTREGEGGKAKAKPLGWGAIVLLSLMAGVTFASAGGMFDWIPALIKDLFDIGKGAVPGLLGPGIALFLLVIAFWSPLTRRQTAIVWLALSYAFADAGKLSIITDAIGRVVHGIVG